VPYRICKHFSGNFSAEQCRCKRASAPNCTNVSRKPEKQENSGTLALRNHNSTSGTLIPLIPRRF
jgi:hypothetical protein